MDSLEINPPTEEPMKHSGIGIASFTMSLGILVVTFILVVIAGVMEASTPGGIDEESPAAIMLGLGIIGMVVLNVAAFGLGIGTLFQRTRKKLFGVLGMTFSALTIIGIISLIMFGMSIDG
jgi:hypothetical protein